MKKIILIVLLLMVFAFPLAAYADTEYIIKEVQAVNNDKLSEDEILRLVPELKAGKSADIKKVSEQVQLANTSNNVKLNVILVSTCWGRVYSFNSGSGRGKGFCFYQYRKYGQ